MAVYRRSESPREPRPRPDFGRLTGLVAQPAIIHESLEWSDRPRPITHVDVTYSTPLRSEMGRELSGAVRNHLRAPDTEWATVERLAAKHLRAVAERDPGNRGVRFDRLPEWERAVVDIDGSTHTVLQSIYEGFEAIAFRNGDRVVSSVFSVFDAVEIVTAFRTFYFTERTLPDDAVRSSSDDGLLP
ncbi:hypothetical protein [Compostimonas suwonensis]|uniref:Uncharacterized protein n=1 Tax=Compostimonas suwonensis TaxID=1048394 RepID=A0A2M9BB23_9MICO|nr:hypothetical protein [Compostimonas suwonensis]PJJ55149.1 hypothetical protein CLV54_3489 [Compostimonas suwonensis]